MDTSAVVESTYKKIRRWPNHDSRVVGSTFFIPAKQVEPSRVISSLPPTGF